MGEPTEGPYAAGTDMFGAMHVYDNNGNILTGTPTLRPEIWEATCRLLAKSWEMREALPTIMPDTHGDHGGPLVVVKAFYEDGSERGISPEKYEKVRALLASTDGDSQ